MGPSVANCNLVNIAIGIEKRGIIFYDAVGRSSGREVVRDTFQYLSGMERRHIQIIQEIFKIVDKSVHYGYDVEYSAYIRALMENTVFTGELADSEAIKRIQDDMRALDLAILAEKDSILLYHEMQYRVSDPAREVIGRIIAEEKAHLLQLAELKRQV